MARAPSVPWTREHFLIALNLYCKLPFGLLHRRNPTIVAVAQSLGRTANSLAMKLCNFASLDPVQRARGVAGLPGATPRDRAMWNTFHSHLDTLGPESEQLLHDLFSQRDDEEVDFLSVERVRIEQHPLISPPKGPTERKALVRVRRGQQFFRQTVINAFERRCCVTGISIPRLLVASHILPWAGYPEHRLNPRNGLCLSALHDAAFDSGLTTLDEKLRVVLSPRLKIHFDERALKQHFARFEGKRIRLPEKVAEPSSEFLAIHYANIFHAK